MVSEGLATFVAVIALFMGVGLGMAIVTGGDAPFACLEKGNFADWLAAIGTWVIGFAAASIAYVSHKRSERERQANEERIKRADAAQLAHAALAITHARGLPPTINRFNSADDSEKTVGKLLITAEELARRANPVVLGEQVIAIMPSNAVLSVSEINDSVDLIQATCTQLLRQLRLKVANGMEHAPLVAWEKGGLEILRENAARITEVSDRYLSEIYPDEHPK